MVAQIFENLMARAQGHGIRWVQYQAYADQFTPRFCILTVNNAAVAATVSVVEAEPGPLAKIWSACCVAISLRSLTKIAAAMRKLVHLEGLSSGGDRHWRCVPGWACGSIDAIFR